MIELGKWQSPRHDPRALGFGIAFVLLGVAGLLRNSGLDIDAGVLSQIALITLGLAGLFTLVAAKRQRS